MWPSSTILPFSSYDPVGYKIIISQTIELNIIATSNLQFSVLIPRKKKLLRRPVSWFHVGQHEYAGSGALALRLMTGISMKSAAFHFYT